MSDKRDTERPGLQAALEAETTVEIERLPDQAIKQALVEAPEELTEEQVSRIKAEAQRRELLRVDSFTYGTPARRFEVKGITLQGRWLFLGALLAALVLIVWIAKGSPMTEDTRPAMQAEGAAGSRDNAPPENFSASGL